MKKLLELAGEKIPHGLEEELENIFRMPLFEIIGLKVEKAGNGRCELSLGLAKEGTRQGEMMHGGITMFALDNAASMAVMTVNGGVRPRVLTGTL